MADFVELAYLTKIVPTTIGALSKFAIHRHLSLRAIMDLNPVRGLQTTTKSCLQIVWYLSLSIIVFFKIIRGLFLNLFRELPNSKFLPYRTHSVSFLALTSQHSNNCHHVKLKRDLVLCHGSRNLKKAEIWRLLSGSCL